MKKLLPIILCVVSIFSFAPRSNALLGQNLLKDGSFEIPKTKDKFGRTFKHWLGWVYEKKGWFEVSPLAQDGKHSCLMRANEHGKIRITSPKLDLEPGRYKLTVYLRGLDIVPHRWKRPIDFSMGFDGEFFPINQSGNFDWTKLQYIFDFPASSSNKVQFFIGLRSEGRLWVDNARLVRVDKKVQLTEKPQWVEDPSEIEFHAPDPPTIRCVSCGFHNSIKEKHCFGCGTSLPKKKQLRKEKSRILANFEHSKKPFNNGKRSTDFASKGSKSLRIEKGWTAIEKRYDFSDFDEILIDTYNPNPDPVPIVVEIRDVASKGYWGRVNYNTVALPGKHTLYIPTDLYVGEKSRPGRSLMKDRISFFSILLKEKGPIYIDNLRLRKIDIDDYLFDELLVFDFGPQGSPQMVGTYHVDKGQQYSNARGYGFVDAKLWRSFDVLQPDPLIQDFVTPEKGLFRVKLKNGKYRIGMKIDSPGGYWGELQVFEKRSISINGQSVYKQSRTFRSFQKNIYKNASNEDLPGVDPFTKYIESNVPWLEYEVEVTNGKLDIGFEGQNWAICLSSLIIYPETKREQGHLFQRWLNQRRKFSFSNSFQEISSSKNNKTISYNDIVFFSRNLNDIPSPLETPQKKELLTKQNGLILTLAGNETNHLPLSIYTQKEMVKGHISAKVTTLQNKSGKILPQDSYDIGWFDFRITRENMDGSIWSIRPRYRQKGNAPYVAGVTRTLSIGFSIPPNQPSGEYKGFITLNFPSGEEKNIPLTITVLPFNLEPIEDIAVGPWGSTVKNQWYSDDSLAKKWDWAIYKNSLKAIKASGSNTFSGIPHINVQAKKGQITLDTLIGDKEMKIAKSYGFHHIVSSYGVDNLGYRFKGTSRGPDIYAAKRAGFSDFSSYIKQLYTKIDRHSQQNEWLPVAWNIADEPHENTIDGSIINAKEHKVVGQHLQNTSFMGATSLTKSMSKPKRKELIKNLPLAALNLHDKMAATLIRNSGNSFGFYNGANRWTLGRYMKMLVYKHNLSLRLLWHFNVTVGDPYYGLDCREDDYCWYNTNVRGDLIPSIVLLTEIIPGLNDYKYLSLLQKTLQTKKNHPNYRKANKIWQSLMNIKIESDRDIGDTRKKEKTFVLYEKERKQMIHALQLLNE